MRRCGQRLVERRSGGTLYHCETGGRSSGLKTSMLPPIGVLPGNAGDEDIVHLR
nr:MAG TPA: hypothetical protein [Caudoviricetes sp.]